MLLDQLDVSKTNELQSRAFHPPQGSLVDMALQSPRWLPASSLGDEAGGCVDDDRCCPVLSGQWRQRQLGSGPLMVVECASVKVSIVIKGKKTKRVPNDANRLAVQQFYGDVCHTHSSPGETGYAATRRIPEHLVELCTRQAIQTVVLVEQKHAA
ncbi:MAG: hypothetical protein HZB64_02505 [Rhodocyclales bacterium]|nr:hypothetical protein [Rhodocyclales bacterium]